MKDERYGHTIIQKKIVEYGIKGELTIRKVLELFGSDNEKKSYEEIGKIIQIGLVKIDKETSDEEGNLYENTRLLWIYDNDKNLPKDPGDVIHNPVANYLYEKQDQFIDCHLHKICQKCGKKNEDYLIYVGLDCEEDIEDKGIWVSIPMTTVVLCKECHSELIQWLNIATHDSSDDYGHSDFYLINKKEDNHPRNHRPQ